MFSLTRLLKAGYILGLAAIVVSLAQTRPAEAQRAPIAPMLSQVDMQMRSSMMMAQRMLMMGGMGGGGMMGMMGGMGMRGGMMGMRGGMMGGMRHDGRNDGRYGYDGRHGNDGRYVHDGRRWACAAA
jgi:hypothetical protein